MKKLLYIFLFLATTLVSAQNTTYINNANQSDSNARTIVSDSIEASKLGAKISTLTGENRISYSALKDKPVVTPVYLDSIINLTPSERILLGYAGRIALDSVSEILEVPDGYYSPSNYGVVTNGSENTTSSFQSFINQLPSNAKVWIAPNETILISNVTSTVQGITFTGGGTIKHDINQVSDPLNSNVSCLRIISSSNVIVENIKFDASNIYYDYGRSTLEFQFGENNLVKNNIFINWSKVSTDRSYNCEITRNTFNESFIFIRDSDFCSANNNLIKLTDATFSGRAAAASIIDGSFLHFGNSIDDNRIITNLGVSSFKGNTGGSISGNRILVVPEYNSYTIPITLADVRNITCNNNIISSLSLADNRNSLAYGLELANVKGGTINGNTVINMSRGIVLDGGDIGGGVEQGLTENIAISGNNLINCGIGLFLYQGLRNISFNGNTIVTNSLYGTRSITHDWSPNYIGIYPQNVDISNNNITFINNSGTQLRSVFLPNSTFSNNNMYIQGVSNSIAITPNVKARAKIISNTITSDSTGEVIGVSINNTNSSSASFEYVNNTGINLYRHIQSEGGRGNIDLRIAENKDIDCLISSQQWESDYSYSYNGVKISYKNAIPTSGSWLVGSRVFSSTSTTSWFCTSTGSFGSTSSLITGNIGDRTATVNSIDGLYIGFVFISNGTTYRIIGLNENTLTIKLDVPLASSLTSNIMTVKNPIFTTI